ncbi:MAG: ATP-binding protein [Woeseiaceae bacterium]
MASHRETKTAAALAGDLRKIDSDDSTEAFFRTVLETAPDAMVIIDAEGKIAIVNMQAENIFGYKHKKLIGKPIEKLLPKRLRDMHVGFRDAYINNPDVRPMGSGLNLTAVRKDGIEFPVEISLSPVETRHGRFVSSVIRDVTERKKMEQKIIAAQQETERANKANNAFLAAASHDLRQPVQALSLLNGALRRTVKDERALEMIEAQDQSLTAMTNLLNSLLDISRLDAGRVTPEIERFPVQRLIDRLSAEFGRQARQKGLEFVSADCDCIVSSDANLLAEIIQNLVSNAIRYTDHGTVRLVCDRDGDDCVIKVIDTGIGIEAEQLDAIFQEFHQCRVQGGSKEGFGLGLAIVRRLADLLGHDVRVESEPGKGSVFSVRLPVVEAPARATKRSTRADAVAGDRSGMIILIEDDENVSNAWGMLLQAEGYEVAKAESAKQARELIGQINDMPALIISDFHLLDGSTGVEAIASIRQHYGADIPAFIVSGDTSKVVKDARPVHNCTMMNKPVDTARLLAEAAIATRSGKVPVD